MTVCNKECFSCPYDDCINDEPDYEDYKAQAENDKAVKDERRGEKAKKEAAYQREYYKNNKEKLKRRAVYERWAEENGIQIPAD